MAETYLGREVQWASSARKHKIGKGSARHVIRTVEHVVTPPPPNRAEPRWWWIGEDDRGRELEVAAVDLADGCLLVIHVFPTALRNR